MNKTRQLAVLFGIILVYAIFIFICLSIGNAANNILAISSIGTTALSCMVFIGIIDVGLLLVKHVNSRALTILSVVLSATAFLVMEIAFVNDYFPIDYVWNTKSLQFGRGKLAQ
jgi:uncharacterized membrane protein YobD (UPF0266 family)